MDTAPAMSLDTIRAKLRDIRTLNYGQSPWDDLDCEELLYLVQSYHAVVAGSANLISILPGQGGWYRDALAMARTATDYVWSGWQSFPDHDGEVDYGQNDEIDRPDVSCRSESEIFYRMCMRPVSGHLAFDHRNDPWWICPSCGTCVAPPRGKTPRPMPCSRQAEAAENCVFRPFTWEDWRQYVETEETSQ